jgi:hypothetical protein
VFIVGARRPKGRACAWLARTRIAGGLAPAWHVPAPGTVPRTPSSALIAREVNAGLRVKANARLKLSSDGTANRGD